MAAPASRHLGGGVPSTKPSTKPSGKPSSRPSSRPSSTPSARPSDRPGVRPTVGPGVAPGRPAAVLRFPVERTLDPAARQARAEAINRHPAGSGLRRPATQPAPLRLTRRGRLVVGLLTGLLVLGLVAAGVLLGTRSASAGRDSAPLPVTYRTVLTGETLWGIAAEVAPDADRRDVVDELVELNALPSADVTAGQRLAVPVGQGW